MKAKCDYLTVTYSPDDSPIEDVRTELILFGAILEPYGTDKKQTLRFVSFGTVRIESSAKFHCISFSGQSLDYLRTVGRYVSVLALLATCHHKVTRLDAAYDVAADAPPILQALIDRYPDGEASLTRKAVKMRRDFGVRDDGLDSGTLYFGYRTKARVIAKVYDKALEALEKRCEVMPPTTRYEVTIKDGLSTLRDAEDPTAIFWHYAAPVLLPLPSPAPPKWTSYGSLLGWEYEQPEKLPMDTLKKYNSKIAPTMLELADAAGSYGREAALYDLAKRLGLRMPVAPERLATASLGAAPVTTTPATDDVTQ